MFKRGFDRDAQFEAMVRDTDDLLRNRIHGGHELWLQPMGRQRITSCTLAPLQRH